MAMPDVTNPVGRIRLACGDISDIPYLDDTTYQYCLDTQLNNEVAATKMAAQLILAQLSYGTHSRLDKIEQWGSEAFNNYLTYIRQVITSPANAAMGGIYVAGLLKDDVIDNLNDDTIVQHNLPVYPYEDYDNSNQNMYGVPPLTF